MLRTSEEGGFKLFAETYQLAFAADRPFVTLLNEHGQKVADLFVLSSVHPLNGRDDTVQAGLWQVEKHAEEVIYSLEAASSVWERKIYRFRCLPQRLIYEVEVEGQGYLAEANYFGGYYSGQVRWGSGFFWSGQAFRQGFNPEPNTGEVYTFDPSANSDINLNGVPLPGKDDWFFTPPPFHFSFETGSGWLGVGVEAQPGSNQFSDYKYHGKQSSFHFSLNFDGHTPVEGRCLLPAITFDFGADPYQLLETHVNELRAAGLVPSASHLDKPAWWRQPIYCGWGSQCYLAGLDGLRAPDTATQANYSSFLNTLESNGVVPGTIVIDDKWQQTYGDNQADPAKWPDLKGFIHHRHANGQKVLLWLKAWDCEALPVEECITNAAGLPLAVDPTNPAFERRLRASVRSMLSASGYDADGFKIDFTARIPSGPGIHTHGQSWGLELMRLYLGILHDEAKRVKPDTLIIAHTPHPYLADLIDSVRLNDINTHADVCRAMTHRARVALAACPDALIDTDNWPITNKQTWRTYLTLKPSLGVPALYYASHIDSTGEPLLPEDYALIREVWAEYRAGLQENPIPFVIPTEELDGSTIQLTQDDLNTGLLPA